MEKYKSFKLTGKKQDLFDVVVFPDCYFDRGSFGSKEYCRHMYSQLWKQDISYDIVKDETIIKKVLRKKALPIWQFFTRKAHQHNSEFYKYKDFFNKDIR